MLQIAYRIDSTAQHEEDSSFSYAAQRLLQLEIFAVGYETRQVAEEEIEEEHDYQREQIALDGLEECPDRYRDAHEQMTYVIYHNTKF